MKKYAILTDTGCDLPFEIREKYGIDYAPMHFAGDGKEYVGDLDWKELSAKDFYDAMRNGTRFISSQVNVEAFKTAFEKYVQEGYDVLAILTSSQISSGVKSSYTARDEVLKKYPDAKIICIDALRACCALGILVIHASEMRAEGKTIEETAAWIEEKKSTVNMIGTVEKLTWLRQAGRVTAASAFFGGLLNIKPIIIADALGRNFAVGKVKGRRVSLEKLAEMAVEAYEDVPYQHVMISHADCLEDAEELKAIFFEKLGKEVEVEIGYVGPGVGASVGPGMVAIYLFGKEVTINKEGA